MRKNSHSMKTVQSDSRCIVGIFAHPDDEVPACGLLRRSRDSGDRVHLICATRGGRNRNPHIVAGDNIAEIRTKEFERVCDTIGAEHSFLDLPDGGAGQWDALGAEKLLTEELTRIDPDIVIATEKIGTSHPDHLKISDLARVAFTSRCAS
jgi:N-acetylglucosamine malate deacetylase 1